MGSIGPAYVNSSSLTHVSLMGSSGSPTDGTSFVGWYFPTHYVVDHVSIANIQNVVAWIKPPKKIDIYATFNNTSAGAGNNYVNFQSGNLLDNRPANYLTETLVSTPCKAYQASAGNLSFNGWLIGCPTGKSVNPDGTPSTSPYLLNVWFDTMFLNYVNNNITSWITGYWY